MNKNLLLVLILFCSFFGAFSQDLPEESITKATNAIFLVESYDSNGKFMAYGTGCFISDKGEAVTALHLIKGYSKVIMKTKNGDKFTLDKVISAYPKPDLAKIKVNIGDVKVAYLPLCKSILYEGDAAFAIGMDSTLFPIVSEGVVSIIRMFEGIGPGLLTALPLNKMHDGAPVVDANSEIIGVISMPYVIKFDRNFALSVKVFENEHPEEAPEPKKQNDDPPKKNNNDGSSSASSKSASFDKLKEIEKALIPVSDTLTDGWNEFSRMDAVTDFIPSFVKALKLPDSYDYPFDSLHSIYKIIAPDNTFRLFSWTLKFDDGTYRYYGAIQKNQSELSLIPLFDQSAKVPFDAEEDTILTNESWFGCQYYDIMMMKKSGKKYYILLGWDGNNPLTCKKIIELLSFDEEGKAVFGAPLFRKDDFVKTRIVIPYATANVILKAIPENNLISFDHLVPPQPKDVGKTWLYIPDGSYDYYKVKRGKLVYRTDLFKHERIPESAIGENTDINKKVKVKK